MIITEWLWALWLLVCAGVMMSAFRAHQVGGKRTLVMALAWVCIFMIAAGIAMLFDAGEDDAPLLAPLPTLILVLHNIYYHPKMADPTDRLLRIMATLRDKERGCDWDLAQTFTTIAPYTIEEAYEVADAVARNDMADLRDELGDLLLQVVFHSRMAEEQGSFSYQDVVTAICDKMESRHPHIFSDAGGTMDRRRWEDAKAAERAAKGAASALDGVAQALPALMRAEKLQKRAARVGFDWPDPSEPSAKVVEELAELHAATPDERLMEAGDLLFAAVNVVRKYGIAAEDALRAGNAKFEARFKAMEALAVADGVDFAALSLDEQEALWLRAKAAERD